jgi:hypothetical protein
MHMNGRGIAPVFWGADEGMTKGGQGLDNHGCGLSLL